MLFERPGDVCGFANQLVAKGIRIKGHFVGRCCEWVEEKQHPSLLHVVQGIAQFDENVRTEACKVGDEDFTAADERYGVRRG